MALLATWDELAAVFGLFGYKPGPEQRSIHESLLGVRNSAIGPVPPLTVVAGGEQGGKSFCAGNHVAAAAVLAESDRGIFWLVGHRYEDARREYQYVLKALLATGQTRKGMFSGGEIGPWTVRLMSGAVIKTLASQDVTVLAREAPDGIVMCEPGRQTYTAFESCWRRQVPHNAWMMVAGTFENDPERWYPDLFAQCQGDNPFQGVSRSIPSYANPENYPLGLNDPKFRAALEVIRQQHPTDAEEIIGERFLGKPRRPQGLVFAEFGTFTHVRDAAEYDPLYPVYLAVDPGWFPSSYAVGFCQIVGEQVRMFDEIYVQRRRTLEIIAQVKNHRAYPRVAGVFMDTASRQHGNAQDSAYETWTAELAGSDIPIITNYVDEKEGRLRLHDKLAHNPLLNQPYLIFHPRCAASIREFQKGYRLRQRTDGTFHSDEPIDENNHMVKALTYLVVGRYGMTERKTPNRRATVQRSAISRVFARR